MISCTNCYNCVPKKILHLEAKKTKLFEKTCKAKDFHGDQKEITLDARNSIALNEREQKKMAFQVQLFE